MWQEVKERIELLKKANEQVKTRGRQYAVDNKNYRIAKAKKILELKLEGYPATLILDLVKGDEVVAELDEKRNISDSLYKSCLEAINSLKIEIKVLTEAINQDWGVSKYD